MLFEWDEKKNKTNKDKHHIGFEDALYVFADPFAITRRDVCTTEERQQILGQVNGVLMVMLVYTLRTDKEDERIRIISARKATPAERRHYEEGKWF
jgi:uncharacterized DUF497 family protein